MGEHTSEEKLAALRRSRANALLDQIHTKARERGADQLTMEEIDAEIAQARRERRKKK